MILNPVVQGGGETATVTIKGSDIAPNLSMYGIWYINPMGQRAFRPFDTNDDFFIMVTKNSYILPLSIGDVRKDMLSGGLAMVDTRNLIYEETGHVTNLIYVTGDGVLTV